ncbi:MAG TPA: hypothetical protein VF815_17500, partial [Myxococcaceae bacterium]
MSGTPGVRVLVALAAALSVWLACSGGLKVEEGNAFPCDFREEEAVRDLQCSPGWRCGIDGRCHEATAEQNPLVTPPTFNGARRFPRVLTGDTRLIAGEPNERTVLVGYDDGGVYSTRMGGAQPVTGLTDVRLVAMAGQYLLVQGERRQMPVRLRLYSRHPMTGALSAERPVLDEAMRPVTDVESIRTFTFGPPNDQRVVFAVVRADGHAGEVDPVTGRYTSFPEGFATLSDGGVTPCSPRDGGCPMQGVVVGRYGEARHVQYSQLATRRQQDEAPEQLRSEPVPVVATASHILWRERPPDSPLSQGRWQVLYTSEVSGGPPPDGGMGDGGAGMFYWMLRHSDRANLWALKRPQMDRDVLSTFEVSRAPNLPGPAMSLAWDDCSPCGEGKIISFTPVTDGALGVEVLCESSRGVRSLVRVVGSSVVAPRDTCLLQPLEAPFELTELASRPPSLSPPQPRSYAVDDSRGTSLVMGGSHGQIWGGYPLSRMRPVFLDRTPVAVESFDGGRVLAFTPDFVAVGAPESDQQRTGMVVALNGPPEAATTDSLGVGNVVQGTPNWLLGKAGQIVQVEVTWDQQVTLTPSYGPTLVAPSGGTATGPFLGQGTPTQDGVSLMLAANDQLYYVDLKKADLQEEQAGVDSLTPRLTPDPSFPVRSMARDRTVSTSAETGVRVRGWASTDRSVFQFEQDAQTRGWTLTPLPIGDGEPVEVWNREAGSTSYGRLGLRDGLVLRLPQGLPLTQKLPEGERVVDYASLAGWPVALGEQGLYRTMPTQQSNGEPGLLKWEPLTLPDGLTAEDLEGARITVLTDQGQSTLYLFTRTGFVYRLS